MKIVRLGREGLVDVVEHLLSGLLVPLLELAFVLCQARITLGGGRLALDLVSLDLALGDPLALN